MIRTAADPYGGCTPSVDKMIGDAFPKVEIVADNIDKVLYVADNMEAIVAAATKLDAMGASLMVVAVAPGPGGSIDVPYPPGVTNGNLRGSSVLIAATDGSIHMPGESTFSCSIIAGSLHVEVAGGAPVGIEDGQIRWNIIYNL